MKIKNIFLGFLKYFFGVAFFIGMVYVLNLKNFSLPEPDRSILGNFIEWYGILLSVLLALLVVQVWTKYNMINLLVDQEADALASLIRFARFRKNSGFFDKLKKEVMIYCKKYSQHVNSTDTTNKKYREQQEKIFEILLFEIKPNEKSCVSNEMIRIFDESIDIRGDREAYIKERVHGSLWFLLIMSSMIWLLSFIWLSFQKISLPLGGFMVLFTTFTVMGLLFIAKDIDNPIGGLWQISYHSFDETSGEIDSLENMRANKETKK